ncbi:hypothetical protein [[Clostridium] fimetarium]|uniref:hypothetical protein n=1 Tax=[Clostridium] fimetarium TaxID=99656 RepID=UPI001113CFCE|nr:hypothetical protein [[Clostridium] fimetarium]
MDEKGKRFEFLVSRLDESKNNGYYIEAMAITYALMEERTYSLLDKLGISYRNKDKLYQCLEYFKKNIIDRQLTLTPTKMSIDELTDWLKVEFIDSGLVDNIQLWREKRNGVIHDLAKTTIEYSDLEETCNSGSEYFRKYTAYIMKLKKVI